ncbi:MAG: PIN domain-containing protein [Nitriliruptorales bacterium]|nr:PIN domain-containing protein [Nitriliruptorales bacterium]
MRLLVDTQSWLWMQAQPERLRTETLDLVLDPGNQLLLSAASAWEIAIKYALGKLPLPEPPHTYVPDRLRSSGVLPLAVTHHHSLAVADLPQHHRDPFDRLLIAQARLENLIILTSDRAFSAYPVQVHWSA